MNQLRNFIGQKTTVGLGSLRGVTAVIIAATSLAAIPTATATGSYAFTQHDLLVRQTLLQSALGTIFHGITPVTVRCRGVSPVRLASGQPGWYRIRCTTSLPIDDYIYALNTRGAVTMSRVLPDS